MKRKLPEKFFEQNQRAKTRKWKFFNLNQALWGAGNREFRTLPATSAVVLRILHACRKLSEFPDLRKWHKAIQGVFQLSD